MELRTIPKCGMAVSLLGLGTNNFGERSDFEQTKAVVHKALDLGITFFDTASTYPLSDHGRSEDFLAQSLGERRKDVVIATKVGLLNRTVVRDSEGNPHHLESQIQDITEQKNAAERSYRSTNPLNKK